LVPDDAGLDAVALAVGGVEVATCEQGRGERAEVVELFEDCDD